MLAVDDAAAALAVVLEAIPAMFIELMVDVDIGIDIDMSMDMELVILIGRRAKRRQNSFWQSSQGEQG